MTRCFHTMLPCMLAIGSIGLSSPPPAHAGEILIDVGRGPVTIHLPSSYDPNVPTPLVILLHGYTSSGQEIEDYIGFIPTAEEYGLLYAYPDGTTDCLGNRFWNATDACCNFCGSNVDDSGYLRALVEEIKSQLNVDQRRIYFTGHSNGGFMSYRMACDHADTVAAMVSLAGATYLDGNDCAPVLPVHTLQIHGTADQVIQYNGGCIVHCYPGAVETTETWASYNDCSPIPDNSSPPIDLVADIPGAETDITRYADECQPGGSAELWTINGGSHFPQLSADFNRLVVEYLLSHPKPVPCPNETEFDLVDMAVYRMCFTGPNGTASLQCECADHDQDGDVDFADFAPLQRGFAE